jgi:hypothetical protein
MPTGVYLMQGFGVLPLQVASGFGVQDDTSEGVPVFVFGSLRIVLTLEDSLDGACLVLGLSRGTETELVGFVDRLLLNGPRIFGWQFGALPETQTRTEARRTLAMLGFDSGSVDALLATVEHRIHVKEEKRLLGGHLLTGLLSRPGSRWGEVVLAVRRCNRQHGALLLEGLHAVERLGDRPTFGWRLGPFAFQCWRGILHGPNERPDDSILETAPQAIGALGFNPAFAKAALLNA